MPGGHLATPENFGAMPVQRGEIGKGTATNMFVPDAHANGGRTDPGCARPSPEARDRAERSSGDAARDGPRPPLSQHQMVLSLIRATRPVYIGDTGPRQGARRPRAGQALIKTVGPGGGKARGATRAGSLIAPRQSFLEDALTPVTATSRGVRNRWVTSS